MTTVLPDPEHPQQTPYPPPKYRSERPLDTYHGRTGLYLNSDGRWVRPQGAPAGPGEPG